MLWGCVLACSPPCSQVRRPRGMNFLRKCHEAVTMRRFVLGTGGPGIFVLQTRSSRWSFLPTSAGDNALLDIVTLLKQRCKTASKAPLLQTHGSASSAVVGDACGKLTPTSARPVNPADALRRTPSRRHGVPVQCAGSTHRLDSRSFARFDPVAPQAARTRTAAKQQHSKER